MIGKIPRPGRGFRGSFQYLMHGKRDADSDVDRLAWMETRNLFVKDMDKIPSMMRATAAQSKKCQKPVYHMIISWRPDEAVSDVTMREVADQALFDLGLNEHQAVLAAHRDTDHRHLHILVNRVHPETGKAWHTSKDWARFERSIARQALKRGLLKVDGRHNTPELMARENKRARDSEYQMAKRLQREIPKDRWSVEEIKSRRLQLAPIFEQSRSWDQLSRLLSAEGLSLTAKGQGLVIDDGMGFMKLSDLGKEVRLHGLEALYRERFTDFSLRREKEQAQEEAAASPTPVGPDPSSPQPAPTVVKTVGIPDKDPAYAQHHAQEAEKDRLRAEWRAKRQQNRQTTGDNEDDNDGTGATQPPRRERAAVIDADVNAPDRREAWKKAMAARENLDLARDLHRSGLIDNDALVRAIDGHAMARDDLGKLLQNEPDKMLLREEWRRQAETQREAILSRHTPQPKLARHSAKPAVNASTPIPHRQKQAAPQPSPQPPSPRLEAFRNLSHAHEQLDIARQLHGLGILSKQELITARNDLAHAREELAKHQTFSEFVGDGVREALSSKRTAHAAPAPKADKKPPPPPPPQPKPQKLKNEKKHKKDRERDR